MNHGRFLVSLSQCSGLFMLLQVPLAAIAQNDLFITVSAPAPSTAVLSPESGGLFTTVSSVVTQPAPVAVKSETKPEARLPEPVVNSAVDEKKTVEKLEHELLRDPFWPIGVFPEGWKSKTSAQSDTDLDGSGWKAAAGEIRIGGTSRLGGRTAAIINGELKSVGEQIEVFYAGKTYQWQSLGVDAEGRVQLKKQGIR